MALPSDTTTALQNQYDTANQNFATGYQDLMAKQNAEESGTYSDLQKQYDVPGLTSQIQGYKNTILGLQKNLSDLAGNVQTRNNGAASAAQLSRQTTAEGIPIQKNINDAGLAEAPLESSLTSAQTNIATQMTLLNDRQARETSGYTTSNQAVLNGLLDKLNAQRTLDDEDVKQANALALQEQQYNLALRNTQATAKITKADATSQAVADIQSGLKRWVGANKPTFWTEQTLIPTIQAAYPELTLADIKNLVYTQRKNPEFGGE